MIFIRNQIRNKTQSLLSPYTAVNQRLITSPTHETTTMISCSLLFHNAKLFSAESREMSRAHKAAKRWEWQMGRTAGTESAVTSSSNLRPTPPPPLSHYLQFLFLNIKTHLHSHHILASQRQRPSWRKMSDWGPVFISVVLFVLLTPGLLFQVPGRHRCVEFGNFHTSGASIMVHSLLYFALVCVFLIAVKVHLYLD